MPDRLSALDASFLYVEEPATPSHVGSVAILRPEDGFDQESLLELVAERIAYVPRYRQRLRTVPGRLAAPVWVDDEHFDLGYHVRGSALPRPGSRDQLLELVGRLMSRPLDRSRPLWEMYLVEGLSGGRLALVSKTHQAVVDGVAAVDIGQVVLSPERRSAGSAGRAAAPRWHPAPGPSSLELVAGAVADAVRRPGTVADSAGTDVRLGADRAARLAGRLAGGVAGGAVAGLSSVLSTATRPAPVSPLTVPIGGQRRFATVDTDLEDYRRIRARLACRINDAVLATVTGALRAWLLGRGATVGSGSTVRALVPVSVRADELGLASRVSAYLVDLPVGEPSPLLRVHQISFAMRAHEESGRAVRARALAGGAGFAPPTLHALGARVAGSLARRAYNLVVTNVPGPQAPLYAGPAPLAATYPVMPLGRDEAVAVGVTSYNGAVCYGLNADRDAMADVGVLAAAIPAALDELVTASSGAVRGSAG